MKKTYLLALTLFLLPLASCSGNNGESTLEFASSEYEIHSGDSVTVSEHNFSVNYAFLGETPSSIEVSDEGVITYDETIPAYTQLLYKAYTDTKHTDPVVITFLQEEEAPTLTFLSPIPYLVSGDTVLATSSTGSAISYTLKETVSGVSIEKSTGRVSYTASAIEGSSFTVVLTSHSTSIEREFYVAKEKLAVTLTEKQATETGSSLPVKYYLDFSDVDSSFNNEIVAVVAEKEIVDENLYTYDPTSSNLILSSDLLSSLPEGEATIWAYTPRNAIALTLIKATKIIKTAAELASINDSMDALAGYYLLANDIDLTDYLALGGGGYDNGQGWKPIGLYHDVTDGTAYNYTFKGTFDGNGYTISNMTMARTDDYAFNAGLFGYVHSAGVIKNLGVIGATMSVKSYSGGLVGASEGTIENCFVEATISTTSSYQKVGGLIGNNLGEVYNSYALSTVTGDANLSGAFVGNNEGTISGCYATAEGHSSFGNGIEATSSEFFASINDFKNSASSLVLPTQYWELEDGSLPSLKHDIPFYYPSSMSISNTITHLAKGETLDVEVTFSPASLGDTLSDLVEYSCSESSITQEGDLFYTENAECESFIITATLDYDGEHYEDSETFYLHDALEDFEIDPDLEYLQIGESYELSCIPTPSTSYVNATYRISETDVIGVSIVDNKTLMVDENASRNRYKDFTLIATVGDVSKRKKLYLVDPTYLSLPVQILYEGESHDISFLFSDVSVLEGATVTLDGEEVSYEISGSSLVIPSSYNLARPDEELEFKVDCLDGTYYRVNSAYLTHKKITESDLPSDVIELSSAEDFKTYFNMADYDESRASNYSKSYVLTNDIDFNNETLCSIGYSGDTGSLLFTGTIYGMGNSIKNLTIKENEAYYTLEDQTSTYRASRYGVGFFGALGGSVYDISFENINVSALSWVGGLAGTMNENAYCENISFISSTVYTANNVDYTTSDGVRGGRITSYNQGEIVACSFGGSLHGLEG